MEKTYTQKVHFKIVIEGDYTCCNMWDEDLCQEADELHDTVLNYVGDNIEDYFHKVNIVLTDLETIEEVY